MKKGLVMTSIMGAILLLGIFGYSLVAAEQQSVSATNTNSDPSGNSSQINIEVNIVNGVAYVIASINGVESQFTLNTTDTNTIISDIASQTGLTTTQVQDNIHFSTENGTETQSSSVENETNESGQTMTQDSENESVPDSENGSTSDSSSSQSMDLSTSVSSDSSLSLSHDNSMSMDNSISMSHDSTSSNNSQKNNN